MDLWVPLYQEPHTIHSGLEWISDRENQREVTLILQNEQKETRNG